MSAKKQINIQELIRLKSKKAGDEAGREALILEDVHALKIAKECGCLLCILRFFAAYIPRKATNCAFSLAMNTNSCVAQACNSLLSRTFAPCS